jgi:four helix bundle protein
MSDNLHHEKLDVYQVAIAFVTLSLPVSGRCPKGYSALGDQLRRAATSIPLNIAEGYGRHTKADRFRHYDIARGSAHECGAILDIAKSIGMIDDGMYAEAKELLVRIVQMLIRLSGR